MRRAIWGVMLVVAAGVAPRAVAQAVPRVERVVLRSSGVLLQGQIARVRVVLRPGQRYQVDAECASDCSAIDLAVRNYSDYEVVTDRRGRAAPTVQVEAHAPGEYVVLVQMRACAVQPCGYRVAVHRLDPAAM